MQFTIKHAKMHLKTPGRSKRERKREKGRHSVQRADGSIEFTFKCTSAAGARTANKNENNGTH